MRIITQLKLAVSLVLPAVILLAAANSHALPPVIFNLQYTFHGNNNGDDFGRSVSSAGDVNNDGFDDLIVGGLEGGLNNGGFAQVYVSQVIIPTPSALAAGLSMFGLSALRRRNRINTSSNAISS